MENRKEADAQEVATAAASLDAPRRAGDLGIRGLLAARRLYACYQPLVDLYTGEEIGYEALVRGPKGSSLERPDQLFSAAKLAGCERELDWECQRAAMQGALDARLGNGLALFMNVEPHLLQRERPQNLLELGRRALAHFPIFVELTERALTAKPAELLSAAARIREAGAGIALDDVGADPRSLALMPVLAPDVIKLDLRLVQGQPSPQIAAIMHAVNAEAERTGAQVLAEGIETEEHRRTALALGARYGQGYLFGRPAQLPESLSVARGPDRRALLPPPPGDTPFEIVAARHATRRGPKRLLLALSRHIEAQANVLGQSALVLSTFQDAGYFTPATAARYSELAAGAALVGALGVGLAERPIAGVRGASLAAEDPLRGEWDVAVIGPHFAAAFVARDLGDDGDDMARRFDFAVTYDRALAVSVATNMIARLAPVSA